MPKLGRYLFQARFVWAHVIVVPNRPAVPIPRDYAWFGVEINGAVSGIKVKAAHEKEHSGAVGTSRPPAARFYTYLRGAALGFGIRRSGAGAAGMRVCWGHHHDWVVCEIPFAELGARLQVPDMLSRPVWINNTQCLDCLLRTCTAKATPVAAAIRRVSQNGKIRCTMAGRVLALFHFSPGRARCRPCTPRRCGCFAAYEFGAIADHARGIIRTFERASIGRFCFRHG